MTRSGRAPGFRAGNVPMWQENCHHYSRVTTRDDEFLMRTLEDGRCRPRWAEYAWCVPAVCVLPVGLLPAGAARCRRRIGGVARRGRFGRTCYSVVVVPTPFPVVVVVSAGPVVVVVPAVVVVVSAGRVVVVVLAIVLVVLAGAVVVVVASAGGVDAPTKSLMNAA